MGSTKEDQAARRAAMQDTIAENRPFFEARMRHHYDRLGLGEWSPRLSPQERAEQKAAAEKAANVAKIKALAEKAGIGVVLVDDPDIEAKIAATHDGTAETVTGNWRGDESGFADEQAETDDENHEDTRGAVARDQAAAAVTE